MGKFPVLDTYHSRLFNKITYRTNLIQHVGFLSSTQVCTITQSQILASVSHKISKTSSCGDSVFLLIHRNDQFTLCIYITYHFKRQLINSELETFASEQLNITMININSQHSPKCDLISFGLFGCFLSLYFFRTGINVKCKLQ